MGNNIDPPSNDELIVRHTFYAKVSSEITTNSKDLDNLANNLRTFVTDFDSVKEEVKATETRNKTIITIAALLWTVIGGSVGLYIQKGLDSYDKQEQRIVTLENTIDKQKIDYENYKTNVKRDFSDISNLINKK